MRMRVKPYLVALVLMVSGCGTNSAETVSVESKQLVSSAQPDEIILCEYLQRYDDVKKDLGRLIATPSVAINFHDNTDDTLWLLNMQLGAKASRWGAKKQEVARGWATQADLVSAELEFVKLHNRVMALCRDIGAL